MLELNVILRYAPLILSGFSSTLIMTISGVVLGLALGAASAFAEILGPRPLQVVTSTVTHVLRGIPLLVLLLLVFYGLPLLGIQLPPLPTAVLAIGIRSGAYQSQILRSAIEAVGSAQLEAAYASGMDKLTAFRNVVLPQALRLSVPGLVNEFTIILKDTSMAYVIGVTEMFTQAIHVAQVTLDYLAPLTLAALAYLLTCLTVSTIANRLYRRFSIPGLGTGVT